jgi:hypothetical protein
LDPQTTQPYPSQSGTISGHIEQIIGQSIRGANAISTFFRCKCTGLTPDQIRRVGDLLLRDPLEGTKYVPPNFKTPFDAGDS